jgi:hypothetical protein
MTKIVNTEKVVKSVSKEPEGHVKLNKSMSTQIYLFYLKYMYD